MKKAVILTALLASSSFLSACTNNVEKSQEISTTGDVVESINTGDIIETTGTLDTIELTGEVITSGNNSIINTGNQETIIKIKTLIDNRKKELIQETGTKKELTEKDIELLESIVNELSRKK